MKYHTIIVGAGIPGLYAARELAKQGKKVLVIDRNKTPGGSNYSTAGIPAETLSQFDVPREGVNCEITNFYYATSKSSVSKTGTEIVAYVLDFKRTKNLLANEVVKFGGEVKWGVTYVSLVKTDTNVTAITTSDGTYEADYFIDASGVEAKLTKDALGLKLTGNIFVGEEYIVDVKQGSFSQFEKCVGIFLDKKLAPKGYAWIFHNGGNQFKIGICSMQENKRIADSSLNEKLKNFIKFIGEDNIENYLEHHGGSKILTNLPKTLFKANVLAIGDAISAINPFLGEGINHGLYSAKFAVEAILANNLQSYKSKWLKYNGIRRLMSEIAFYMLYIKPSQKLYELLIRTMREQNLTTKDISDIGFRYKFGRAVKKDWLLPFKMLHAFVQA